MGCAQLAQVVEPNLLRLKGKCHFWSEFRRVPALFFGPCADLAGCFSETRPSLSALPPLNLTDHSDMTADGIHMQSDGSCFEGIGH